MNTFALAITHYTCKGLDFQNKRLLDSLIEVKTFDQAVEMVRTRAHQMDQVNSDAIVDKFKQTLSELKVGELPVHAVEIHNISKDGNRTTWCVHSVKIS